MYIMNEDKMKNVPLKKLAVLTINEACEVKGCTRQTLWNNRKHFNWFMKAVINDEKFKAWKPDIRGSKKKEKN